MRRVISGSFLLLKTRPCGATQRRDARRLMVKAMVKSTTAECGSVSAGCTYATTYPQEFPYAPRVVFREASSIGIPKSPAHPIRCRSSATSFRLGARLEYDVINLLCSVTLVRLPCWSTCCGVINVRDAHASTYVMDSHHPERMYIWTYYC